MTSEFTDITNTIGVVLFFGVLAGVLADKYRIPKMIPLIFVGIGLSSFSPGFLLNFEFVSGLLILAILEGSDTDP